MLVDHIKVATKVQMETYEERKLCMARYVYLRGHRSAPSGRSWPDVWGSLYQDDYAAYLVLKMAEKGDK